MIDTIQGTIKTIKGKSISIAAEGSGIDFAIQVPLEAAFTLGKPYTLFIHMHWNQEQGPTLYGFTTDVERTVFLLITSCSGIGPKIGLACLGYLGASGTIEAISQEESNILSKVPGIGKKKAEQIIVHLKHKVADLINSGVALGQTDSIKQWQQITQVLTSLNYSRQEVTSAVQHVKKNENKDAPFDHALRTALAYLSKLR